MAGEKLDSRQDDHLQDSEREMLSEVEGQLQPVQAGRGSVISCSQEDMERGVQSGDSMDTKTRDTMGKDFNTKTRDTIEKDFNTKTRDTMKKDFNRVLWKTPINQCKKTAIRRGIQ